MKAIARWQYILPRRVPPISDISCVPVARSRLGYVVHIVVASDSVVVVATQTATEFRSRRRVARRPCRITSLGWAGLSVQAARLHSRFHEQMDALGAVGALTTREHVPAAPDAMQ